MKKYIIVESDTPELQVTKAEIEFRERPELAWQEACRLSKETGKNYDVFELKLYGSVRSRPCTKG